jgi:hypothetical protein
MLRNSVLVLFSLTFLPLVGHANPQQEPQQNGRFQISSTMTSSRSEAFVLDTQTGQVWMITNNFGSFNQWVRLPALPRDR